MWTRRYFSPRFWAARFWLKLGNQPVKLDVTTSDAAVNRLVLSSLSTNTLTLGDSSRNALSIGDRTT